MPYFATQIWTGGEEKFLTLARRSVEESSLKLIWPRRSLRILRRGSWRDVLSPIFPSYVFIEAETVDPRTYWVLRRIPGFLRFLLSNENIVPLERNDQDLLLHFLAYGEVVGKSSAAFDVNGRITVLAGPLRGLEGRIVKVDRRKGRAKVMLEMYSRSYAIDFSFEALESVPVRADTVGDGA